jgi:hypothetical protein
MLKQTGPSISEVRLQDFGFLFHLIYFQLDNLLKGILWPICLACLRFFIYSYLYLGTWNWMNLFIFVEGQVEEEPVYYWSSDSMPLSKTIGNYLTFLSSNLAYWGFYNVTLLHVKGSRFNVVYNLVNLNMQWLIDSHHLLYRELKKCCYDVWMLSYCYVHVC